MAKSTFLDPSQFAPAGPPPGGVAIPNSFPPPEEVPLKTLTPTEELAELQLWEARERREKTQREAAEALKTRLANIEQIKRASQLKEYQQLACQHRKPSGYPATAAQRDHQGRTHFICQNCEKMWVDAELPPDLRIPADHIGGPQL